MARGPTVVARGLAVVARGLAAVAARGLAVAVRGSTRGVAMECASEAGRRPRPSWIALRRGRRRAAGLSPPRLGVALVAHFPS